MSKKQNRIMSAGKNGSPVSPEQKETINVAEQIMLIRNKLDEAYALMQRLVAACLSGNQRTKD